MSVRGVTQALAIVVALADGAASASSHIACDRCAMTIAGTRVTVTGDLLAVDFTARAPRWSVGELAFRDVVLDVHRHGDAIRACAAGTPFDGARVVACTSLPGSLAALMHLHDVAIAWRVTSGDARGRGTARVTWAGDEVRLSTQAELTLPSHIGRLELAGATASARISGTLSPLALSIEGRAHADTLAVASFRAHDVVLPLDTSVELRHAALEIVPHAPIALRAEDATIDLLHLIDPVLALDDTRPVTLAGLATDPHELTWTALAGLPVEFDAGSASVRFGRDGVYVDGTRLAAADGTIAIDPFEIRDGAPVTTRLHLHGIALDEVLDLATRGRVRGTGVLDGDVDVRRDATGFALERGEVRARGPGDVHVRSSGKLAGQVGRIASALTDFTYDRLALVVRAPGNDPESTLVLHGRGEHVPQELDLTINLHGARVAARSFVSRVGQ